MRKILALAVVGAVSLSSMVTAMAQQTPQHPNQAPSSQNPSSQPSSKEAPSSPQATSSQAPANQIDSARTQSNERSLTEFWTPERLREARPMPTPRVDPDEVKK
jgi:cytoskeletal protein RodZ